MKQPDEYAAYYKEQLESALEFQDFVAEVLFRRGIPLVNYQSRKWQRGGENKAGFEIKYDKKYAETGNLYIETAEKSHPDNPSYVASGIYRDDNTWIWVIGDRRKLFVLPKTLLRGLCGSGRYRSVEKPTSRGFLLPELHAQKYAALVINDPEAEVA